MEKTDPNRRSVKLLLDENILASLSLPRGDFAILYDGSSSSWGKKTLKT